MDNTETNPYQAPEAELDIPQTTGQFNLGEPKRKPIGHAWLWIKQGFQLFKAAPWQWILTTIVGFIIFLAMAFIPIIGQLISMLSTYIWLAGIMIGCHAAYTHQDKFSLKYLFAGFKNQAGKLVGLSVIMTLLSIIIMLAAMGPMYFSLLMGEEPDMAMSQAQSIKLLLSILIAVAVMLPLMMAVWFAPALIVLNQVPLFKAMKMSFFGCLKNFLPFLIYGLIGFVLYIVAFIPVGLGLLVLLPTMLASIYTSYRDIFLEENPV